jgi:tight adherence protein C
MDETLILTLCVAAAVTSAVVFLTKLVFRDGDEKLRGRLQAESGTPAVAADKKGGSTSFLQRIGQAAAKPFIPSSREKQSTLRKKLGQAGIYSASAMRMVVGCKVILLLVGLGLGYAIGSMLDMLMLGVSVGGLIGYLLPTMWLASKIKKNKRELNLSLPDALDLMVVCIEAGLTVDLAMQRVGEELSLAHPALSREFGITLM